MGENHILKDNRWFVYDVKWPKLENAKPTGLPIVNGNGDELILLNGTRSNTLALLWRFQIFMTNCAVAGALPWLLFIDC